MRDAFNNAHFLAEFPTEQMGAMNQNNECFIKIFEIFPMPGDASIKRLFGHLTASLTLCRVDTIYIWQANWGSFVFMIESAKQRKESPLYVILV